jgi:hypothetical protein
MLREVYPHAHRVALDVLGNAGNARLAALRGLSAAAAGRGAFSGQRPARDWVLAFVEAEISVLGKRWGLKHRAVHDLAQRIAAARTGPMDPPSPAEMAELQVELASLDIGATGRSPRRFGELAWVFVLAAVVLVVTFRFARANTGDAPNPLFPAALPPAPTLIIANLGPYTETAGYLDGPPPVGPVNVSDSVGIEFLGSSAPFSPIDSRTRRPVLGHINDLALSPDGRLAATRFNDEVVIWTLPEGAYAYAFPIYSWDWPLAFANDENLLAAAGAEPGSVTVWEVTEDSSWLVFTLAEQEGALVDLDFSPDDRYLLYDRREKYKRFD